MAVMQAGVGRSKNWLFDSQIRAILYQVITVILFVGFVAWLSYNTVQNLEQRGIASGFGFLGHPAGFGVPMSFIEYSEESSYGRAFLLSVINTLFISIIGIVLATIIGFLFGVMRLSSNFVVKTIATIYLETARNIPLLLQILFWYFGVLSALPLIRDSIVIQDSIFINNRGIYTPAPVFEDGFGVVIAVLLLAIAATIILAHWARKRMEATGQQFPVFWVGLAMIVGLPMLAFLVMGSPISWEVPNAGRFNIRGGVGIIPEFLALLAALTIYTAAFIGEIVRAGIQAVSHGQTEAAQALGLKRGVTLRLVIIPQAMRVIIPPLTSQYLNLAKNSSLAAAIGYPDLVGVFAGTVLNQTGQALECMALTMLVYLTISLSISVFMNWYNRRVALVER